MRSDPDQIVTTPSRSGTDHAAGWIDFLRRLPAELLVLVVRIYQRLISPLLGPCCRFEPSCSQYFILSVRKYGAIRGTLRGVWRICRCHPWHPGGYDPP